MEEKDDQYKLYDVWSKIDGRQKIGTCQSSSSGGIPATPSQEDTITQKIHVFNINSRNNWMFLPWSLGLTRPIILALEE